MGNVKHQFVADLERALAPYVFPYPDAANRAHLINQIVAVVSQLPHRENVPRSTRKEGWLQDLRNAAAPAKRASKRNRPTKRERVHRQSVSV